MLQMKHSTGLLLNSCPDPYKSNDTIKIDQFKVPLYFSIVIKENFLNDFA